MSTHCVADFSRGAGYNPTVAPDRFEQRQMYLDAIHLIKTSQFSRLQKLKPQLRTYPLYPYLEYTEISYRISRQSEQDILRFVEQYKDTPLVESLLAHWLSNLAKRGKWEIFVTHYDKVTPTKKLACQHAYGLYKVGMVDQALTQAEKLWTVGFSQPDECDSIFNVWRGANGITPEIAWQRFALSLKENNKDLASYLIRFVDRQDKPFATNYRLVHLKPKTIKRYKSFKATNIRNREIILHGVKRLSRLDPEDALLTLEKYEKLQDFNPDELEDAYTYIGVRLAGKSSDLALVDSLPVNLHEHPKLVEARIRQNLKHGDWSNVMVLINLLPQEQQKSNRWQYWKARALGLSADEADREIARNVMIELSSERSFYGFVSADILQNQYNYQDEPSPVTLEQILSLEESPGIQRALELFALGERSQARREWYFSTSDFNNVERDVAARVALRWGWYKASIQTMIDAGAWNHLDHRFPIAYADTFITHARRANIPVQWSLAIARQESSFMTDAKSSAGALGVMQLMPATAKQVAAKIGVSYPNNRSLTSPDLNIRLGTNYLAQMLRKFDNNRILASAAYNAGPGRVNQWLNPDVPFDVWIEIIPFTETRNYVQNVLMFSSIYSRRMNERQPLIYAHERNYFSPQQVSAIQALAEKLSVKPPENT
ncbi:MAG: transglycosylase SLT domain-containing protein [Gammaproteobacteria bacterium]|nr:transglycosylase SLT domain-containing protein [Gammaproteobacteria bacterium]MBT6572801.1 transglycosylase SLT domain-containing protein [Gammaproteobacteria bacterium]